MIETNNTSEKTTQVRPPIVVVLGHVDHGKTTLLDFIRKTRVAAKETGGITQHLGASEVLWNGKNITFLDTPGHETFSKMRERGARVADIAILVVAADDGVKPQTKEALSAITAAKIPFIIALNKVDKATAEPDRVKSELAEIGVLVEGWGGNIPIVPLSAKQGSGIEELLDTVLLVAELEELTWDRDKQAEGVVIEAHQDSRRGSSATLLITDGVLRRGMFVVAGDALASVRILEDSIGNAQEERTASQPALVAGFSKVPSVGASFETFIEKSEAEKQLANDAGTVRRVLETASEVGLLIKADVAGSCEALEAEIKKNIPQELSVQFFGIGAGEVTESDVKNISSAKKAIILAFRTKAKPNVEELAGRLGVEIKSFDLIYEAIDWIGKTLKELVPKKIIREDLGALLVLKVFGAKPEGKVIGGRVRKGRIPKGARFDIMREESIIGSGTITSVQRNKITVDVLNENEEGGLLVSTTKTIHERDMLNVYFETEESQTK